MHLDHISFFSEDEAILTRQKVHDAPNTSAEKFSSLLWQEHLSAIVLYSWDWPGSPQQCVRYNGHLPTGFTQYLPDDTTVETCNQNTCRAPEMSITSTEGRWLGHGENLAWGWDSILVRTWDIRLLPGDRREGSVHASKLWCLHFWENSCWQMYLWERPCKHRAGILNLLCQQVLEQACQPDPQKLTFQAQLQWLVAESDSCPRPWVWKCPHPLLLWEKGAHLSETCASESHATKNHLHPRTSVIVFVRWKTTCKPWRVGDVAIFSESQAQAPVLLACQAKPESTLHRNLEQRACQAYTLDTIDCKKTDSTGKISYWSWAEGSEAGRRFPLYCPSQTICSSCQLPLAPCWDIFAWLSSDKVRRRGLWDSVSR